MKFSINQSELQIALNTVQKGASTRSTLPVLSGIYIVASGDQVVFQTTNLELLNSVYVRSIGRGRRKGRVARKAYL